MVKGKGRGGRRPNLSGNGGSSNQDINIRCNQNKGAENPRPNQESTKSNEICKGGLTNSCGKPVLDEDEALRCDSCDIWFHISCQGVTKHRYDAILALHDDDMPWYCLECRIVVPRLLNSLGIITKRCDAMEDEIHHLKLRVTDLEDKELNDEVANKDFIKQECRDLFQTQAEREKRKNNIMIFGLAESGSPNLESRIQDDKINVQNILSEELGIKNVIIDKVIRLTPRTDGPAQISDQTNETKPRPLKVILSSDKYKGEILKKAKILKNPNKPEYKVTIAPDLCKVDKEENDKLVNV